ncbi:MAG: cbb3-type cytochrome oxidase assembly protein CcoS [Sulfurovum sp.]|nr:cbb3-type cytochrome oxidase assembly protein CcoS [Sulfurovum sp.]
MSSSIMAMMIGISTFLGALGLAALIWGVRTGQFDDESKFIDGARFDGEDELRDAIKMDEKKKKAQEKVKKAKAAKEKNYMPPD